MKRNVCTIVLVMALAGGFSNIAQARDAYLPVFNKAYSTSGTKLDTCNVCHTVVPTRNAFGSDFASTTIPGHTARTFDAALESRDSDGDTFTNIVEINARTFPGNANSKPSAPADPTPPTASLSIGSFATPRKVGITLTATDDVGGSGVKGYTVSLSSTPPPKSSLKWKAIPPAAFTFPLTATSGAKTLYAWAKDNAGNISPTVSALVDLDVTKPTVTAFTAEATSRVSGTVNISIIATDPPVNGVASGVTTYMVTKSNLRAPPPTSLKWISGPAAPTSVTFPTTVKVGALLYAWVKDANGNVSKPMRARVTAPLAAPVAQQSQSMAAAVAQPSPTVAETSMAAMPDAPADMSMWIGKWFQITMKNQGFYTGKSGLSTDRQTVPGYLKISDWDPVSGVFQGDLYAHDAETNQWTSGPLLLNYISGDGLDFEVWSQVAGDLTYGFTARIQGNETTGALTGATFRTLGGYHVHRANQQGSKERLAGWLAITGRMVSESEVQVPADMLQH